MKKILVVGGNFGVAPKKSSIAARLAAEMDADCVNGGTIADLHATSLEGKVLTVWMPNIDNEEAKVYPKKDIGSVLIVSKVNRGSEIEAISRIFKMNGNAVISISKTGNRFSFKLIDALANAWIETDNVEELAATILDLGIWTMGSERKSLKKCTDLEKLVELNRIVADKFEKCYGRFFGNCSTRCQAMFPSTRYFFSKRNVDKSRLSVEDMVYVSEGMYYGAKPSVDTPVQLELYRRNPAINFFIHGHSYIVGAPTTGHYFPCGDMREVEDVQRIITSPNGCINLLKHGFLMYASNLQHLENIVNYTKLTTR